MTILSSSSIHFSQRKCLLGINAGQHLKDNHSKIKCVVSTHRFLCVLQLFIISKLNLCCNMCHSWHMILTRHKKYLWCSLFFNNNEKVLIQSQLGCFELPVEFGPGNFIFGSLNHHITVITVMWWFIIMTRRLSYHRLVSSLIGSRVIKARPIEAEEEIKTGKTLVSSKTIVQLKVDLPNIGAFLSRYLRRIS